MMKLFWFALQWNFRWGALRQRYAVAFRDLCECVIEAVVNTAVIPIAIFQVLFTPFLSLIDSAWSCWKNPDGVKKLMAQKQKWDEENEKI